MLAFILTTREETSRMAEVLSASSCCAWANGSLCNRESVRTLSVSVKAMHCFWVLKA